MNNSNDADDRQAHARAAQQGESVGGRAIKPMRPDTHTDSDPAVETPVEGRQGFLGRPVLAVLIGGLLLVGVAWLSVHYAVR